MKKISLALLVIISFYIHAKSQTPITVVDTSFKLGVLGEQFLYFGFAKGDELIFSFQEQNGKELKEIEIVEWPATSRYKESKTSNIQKNLTVPNAGVYMFRFTNTVLLPKTCNLKIQRIASAATQNFNSTVYWHTVYDTTYRSQQTHVPVESYKTVSLVSPTTFYLEVNTPDTKPRLVVPVTLPDFTSEWYYVYAATSDKRKAETLKSALQLTASLRQRISETGNLSFSTDSLPIPAGSDTCRIYLLDQSNQQLFESKVNFRHFKEGTRENTTQGLVKIKIATFPNAYLGIRNTNAESGIYVALEAVAIIAPDDAGQSAETLTLCIKARNEPYLKN
jgi:hypothetical protein